MYSTLTGDSLEFFELCQSQRTNVTLLFYQFNSTLKVFVLGSSSILLCIKPKKLCAVFKKNIYKKEEKQKTYWGKYWVNLHFFS